MRKKLLSRRQKRYKKKTRRLRRQRGGSNQASIPIFIISWNQYTYVKSMVDQLQKYPGMNIYIIDNKSTYEPLVKYLKEIDGKNGVKVLYQDKNYGHKVYETDHFLKFIDDLGVKKYVVTDPDLTLNTKMPSNFLEVLSKVSDMHKANKVGLALDITNNIDLDRRLDNKEANIAGQTIPERESEWWKDPIPDPQYKLYRASIDTTFALINKEYRQVGKLENSIRIAGDFTAVHRPWLKGYENEMLPGELDYYVKSKDNKIGRAHV